MAGSVRFSSPAGRTSFRRTFLAGLFLSVAATTPSCAGPIATTDPDETGAGGGETGGDSGDGSESGGAGPSGGSSYVFSGGADGLAGAGSGGSATGGMNSSGSGGGPVQLPTCMKNSECDDSDACTDDACVNGDCKSTDNGTCECTVATQAADCDDDQECTDDTCNAGLCEYAPSTGACTDDGDPCTTDTCSASVCGHEDSGLCGEDTVVVRSMRDGNEGQWISLNGTSQLVWNAAVALGDAELFNQIDGGDGTFKLQAVSSGNYVVLGDDDTLEATGTSETAAVFETAPCGSGVGLSATNDDSSTFAAAEGSGIIVTRSGGCDGGNESAWERFEIIPAGG